MGDNPRSKKLVRAAQITLGLVVGLVIAEAAFWLRDGGAFPHLNCYLSDLERGVRLQPGASQKISFGGNPVTSIRINQAGFRGAELPPPGNDEVLVVGDSQVFGLGVEENETFSAKLASNLGGRTVVNAGIPTYGPLEYNQVLKEQLETRKPKTVVYVVNFVNDPFEAVRKNTERHAVWDGWAVRLETAPASTTWFPGRTWLYRDSHAVFALRQLLHGKGPERDDRGFRSEGTWRDLVSLSDEHDKRRALAEEETVRRFELHEAEMRYSARAALAAELHVKLVAYQQLGLSNDTETSQVYLSEHANPGDIVVPQMGEEGRPLAASARYIRDAANLRTRFEKKLKEKAEAAPDEADSKEIVRSITERDALEDRLRTVLAEPVEVVRAGFPLLREVEHAKTLTEKAGARFVLVVLPFDVQVSAEEWKKYGAEPIDMSASSVLVEDLIEGTRAMGASALDATEALRAAEPGAFLNADIHMTPKGHDAVAKAIGELLQQQAPKSKTSALLALDQGRSRVPRPKSWDTMSEVAVAGSTAAHCATKRIREWLFVQCTQHSAKDPKPTGVTVEKGGHGESMTWAADGVVTMLAPIVAGDLFQALFTWNDRSRRLTVDFTTDKVEPDMGFKMAGDGAPARPSPLVDAICACQKQVDSIASCGQLVAEANEDCVRTYEKDCKRMLSCVQGFAVARPSCKQGHINAGAALHCYPLCGEGGACEGGTCVEASGLKVCVKPASPGARVGKAAEATVFMAASEPPAEAIAAFDGKAKLAIKAAQTALEACNLLVDSPGDWFDFEVYDWCEWKAGTIPAYAKAVGELSSLVGASPELNQGPRRSVVEQLTAFKDWLELADRAKQSRGSCALFQDLAQAWNAYRPEQKVDTDPKPIVEQYHVKMKDTGAHYIAKSYKLYDARKKYGFPLPWRRGVHGPRLPNG